MGKRGPPQTPTALKLMRGNPGKRPINDLEPRPEPEIPEAPGHLPKYARDEWDRITVELHTLGLLSQIDRGALSVYCSAWGRHVEAEYHLLAEGLMVVPMKKNRKGEEVPGKPMPNRWLTVSNGAIELVRHMIAEFGLSPSARTRLTVTKKPQKSPEEALFG